MSTQHRADQDDRRPDDDSQYEKDDPDEQFQQRLKHCGTEDVCQHALQVSPYRHFGKPRFPQRRPWSFEDFLTNFIQNPALPVSIGQSLDADEQLNGPACRALYERKAAELILYGRALGLTHGEAEDVLQETFVALLRLPDWPEQPDRYCIRAYRNRALNARRSLWNRVRHELESRRWFERGSAESPWERAAMRCLASLPVEQREVIVLKIWHQHTFEEIGELLTVSPNTAAGRYRYGLQKLRTCLKTHENERPELPGVPDALLDAAPPFAGA